MWLRLVGRMASSSWQQVVLHRDWGRHVAALRQMVTVDGFLLLLRLLMHSRVHLVLLGATSCIRRPLPKVLRRTGTSLLCRSVGGEPKNMEFLRPRKSFFLSHKNLAQHSKINQLTLLLDWEGRDIPPDPGVGPGRGNKSLT